MSSSYEIVRAVLRYAVDPTTDAGGRIVDLDRAPLEVGFSSAHLDGHPHKSIID